MRRAFFLVVVTCLLFLCNIVSYAADFDLEDIKCGSYILIDAKTGLVICQKKSDQKHYPASTTKIMTGLIALEYADINRKYVASYNAVNDIGKDGMNIGIVAGEEMRLEDLLNALLVRSANECANIIAENLAPTKQDFINLMNKKALDLGATNTTFVNPCGKDTDSADLNHQSTAADLAKIGRYAMTIPKFREIVAKRICRIYPTNKNDKDRYLGSTNKLLGASYKSPFYSKITGIKTGYTDKAGQNLVSSAIDKDGNELIAVVMAVHEDNVFSLTKKLFEYGFKNLSTKTLLESNAFYKSIEVSNSPNYKVDLVALQACKSLFPVDNTKYNWEIATKESINPSISLPVKKGDKLGQVEYLINNVSVGKSDLISNTDILVAPSVFSSSLENNNWSFIAKSSFILLIVFSLIFLVMRRVAPYFRSKFYHKTYVKNHNKKKVKQLRKPN